MSTQSYIAKKQPDETFKAVYCHFDGYPDGVGRVLVDSFTDESKVDRLLELGSLSNLRSDIESENDFDNPNPDQSVAMAYYRDRGDDLEINEFSNLETMLDYFDKSWGDYLYLFENVWLVKNDDNDFFMEVKEVLNENS
jgi:hypothetical protein